MQSEPALEADLLTSADSAARVGLSLREPRVFVPVSDCPESVRQRHEVRGRTSKERDTKTSVIEMGVQLKMRYLDCRDGSGGINERDRTDHSVELEKLVELLRAMLSAYRSSGQNGRQDAWRFE